MNESLSLKPSSVLYEDNHLLVVDKHTGIATQGAKPEEPTMAKLAASYLKRKYSKPGNVFIGVVSRLDSRVSGVLVLARTSKAAARLAEQIRQHQVEKHYLACVEGLVSDFQEPTEVVHWLRKNENRHRMEVVSAPTEGKSVSGKQQAQQAKLKLRVISSAANCSLIAVELITGRKHQIRVQLAELGFPILGDTKYGGAARRKSTPQYAESIALHCVSQKLMHPTKKEKMEFRSSPNKHWSFVPRKLLELVP